MQTGSTIMPERFSDLVGAIYDCAITPALWPQTIAAIAEAANCLGGMISVLDLDREEVRILSLAGYPPGCADWIAGNGKDAVKLYRSIPDLTAYYDEPVSPRRALPAGVFDSSPYVREIRARYGIVDSITLILVAERGRVLEIGLSRHERYGFITDHDVAVVRLLAPHIRRAVTIGDLIDMKTIEVQALGAALDNIAVGVVIAGGEGRILHSNAPARGMLAQGSPIISRDGRLATLQSGTTDELLRAIAIAQTDEAGIGKLGIGLPLTDRAKHAATAHVLPLARGERRGWLTPEAAAAVFVMSADMPRSAGLDVVARMFSLTPAESRLLGYLAAGDDIAKAAAGMGIAEATAKTHRTHLFAKMDVKRRADLLALLARLVPPVTRQP